MDSHSFQTHIDAALTAFLNEQFYSYQKIGGQTEVIQYLEHIQSVTTGGKRIRPYLTWSILSHYKPTAKLEDHVMLLAALELFHVFCLIHDDVMDESSERHGTHTMHAQAAQTLYQNIPEPSRTKVSDSQAILAGDILLNHVFKLFYRYIRTHTLSNTQQLIDTFHTLVDEVCLGQMIDIDLTTKPSPDNETIIQKNILKTARYSFVQPLSLGALIADRADLLPFLSDFGEKLGLLYQIQDDILDVTGNPRTVKKPLFQDVSHNQPTVLSQYILKQSDHYKTAFEKHLGKPVTPEDYSTLKSIYVESGALAHAQSLVSRLEEELPELFASHAISEADQTFYTQTIALVHDRQK